MFKRQWWTCGMTAMGALAIASAVHATPTGTSIGLNFGTNVGGGGPSPGSSDVIATALVGAPGLAQTNWMNLPNATGSQSSVTMDVAGVAAPAAGTSVSWRGSGSSDPGGNDQFNPSSYDFELYQGYLDTDDNTTSLVNVRNLPASFVANGYDVVVYFLGSVSYRGGTHGIAPIHTVDPANPQAVPANPYQTKRLNNQSGAWVADEFGENFIPSGPQQRGPTYVEDPGVDFNDVGNYAVFHNLNVSEFTYFATVVGDRTFGFGDRERAPISGLQIIMNVPEPTGLALVGVGAAAFLGRRRRV